MTKQLFLSRVGWLGLFLMLAPTAYGWGLKAELRAPRAMAASLTAKALQNHSIRFCLSMPSPLQRRFPPESVTQQIVGALRLWLTPLEAVDQKPVVVVVVRCEARPDLMVVFGPTEPDDRSNGAYTRTVLGATAADDYVLVHLNTDYVWHETRGMPGNPNGTYGWQDFAGLAARAGQDNVAALMRLVSQTQPQSLDAFAAHYGIAHSALFWTTYRAFIHEFGHAFGLCDTEPSLFDAQCDKDYRSTEVQPRSVMRDANYFYLTEDDRLGLAAVRWLARR